MYAIIQIVNQFRRTNMDINYKKNGAAEINGMIKAAVEDRSRTAVIRGNYEIEDR